MWLGEQITERGIGNGMSLLIFFSIIERIWPETLRTIDALKARSLTFPKLLLVLVVMGLVVAATRGARRRGRRDPPPIPRHGRGGRPYGRRRRTRRGLRRHPASALAMRWCAP